MPRLHQSLGNLRAREAGDLPGRVDDLVGGGRQVAEIDLMGVSDFWSRNTRFVGHLLGRDAGCRGQD
jgi:hypothetical protein